MTLRVAAVVSVAGVESVQRAPLCSNVPETFLRFNILGVYYGATTAAAGCVPKRVGTRQGLFAACPLPRPNRAQGRGCGRGLRGLCASHSAHLERLLLELGRDELFLAGARHTLHHIHTPPTHKAPVSPACQRLRTRGSDMGRRKAPQETSSMSCKRATSDVCAAGTSRLKSRSPSTARTIPCSYI
jgi:hypothetical protein